MIGPENAWRRPGVLAWAVVGLSILLYLDTIRNPLLFDSRFVVLEDPSIRSLGNIPSFFLEPSLPPPRFEGGGEGRLDYYRPATKILLALEYAVFGEHPAGYHLVSILLNAVAVLLFFRLVRAVSGRDDVAFVASLLYGVNPGRSEAVYWVYGQSDILMAVGILAALLLYHRRRYLPAALAFTASLLCRETAIVLPVVLLLLEWLLRRDEPPRRFLRPTLFLIPVAVFLVARTVAVGAMPPVTDLAPFTLLNTAAVVMKRFLKILVIPDAPVAHYPLELFPRVTGEVLVSYGIVVGCIVLLAAFLRKERSLAFWLLFGFSWLALWLNVGKFGHYLMTEKGLYLAAGGFAVVFASLLLRLRHAPVVVAMIVVAQAGMVVVRGTYWRTPVTYFETAIRFSPELPQLRTSLAAAHHEGGDAQASFVQLREALTVAPEFAPARYTLAMLYVERKEYLRAVPELERLVEEFPRHTWALNSLGNCYLLLGLRDRAVPLWSRALAADPRNAEAAYNLGTAAENEGRPRDALRYYRHYLEHAEPPLPRVVERIRRLEEMIGREQE